MKFSDSMIIFYNQIYIFLSTELLDYSRHFSAVEYTCQPILL